MRRNEKLNKKLLVEGKDDQHVILAICKKYNISESFDVVDCEGVDALVAQIPVRLKQSHIEAIGIIVDADADISSRWDSLKITLNNIGIVCPDILPLEGLIVHTENQVKIGVWIMPNNNVNGMLEDFIAFLIPENDKLSPMVDDHLKKIEEQKLNKYNSIHRSKATIHSWLSLQEDPGTPLGLAITKSYLSTDNTYCQQLLNWLNGLFNA